MLISIKEIEAYLLQKYPQKKPEEIAQTVQGITEWVVAYRKGNDLKPIEAIKKQKGSKLPWKGLTIAQLKERALELKYPDYEE